MRELQPDNPSTINPTQPNRSAVAGLLNSTSQNGNLVYTNETVMPGRLTPEKADIHV
jgi:hypothetical protein